MARDWKKYAADLEARKKASDAQQTSIGSGRLFRLAAEARPTRELPDRGKLAAQREWAKLLREQRQRKKEIEGAMDYVSP